MYSDKVKNKIIAKLPLKFYILEEIMNNLWEEIKAEFISMTY